jgi:2-oxoglutarate dehydrogenase E2 component (dihydrolipoamide succinyltransferase)
MTTEIIVPELGESVVEATVGHWQKEPGEPVKIGDILVNLETDKVDVEIGARQAGVLGTIDADAQSADGSTRADNQDVETDTAPDPAGDSEAETLGAEAEETETARPAKKLDITPVARRMAEEQQIDLSQASELFGDGRITKEVVKRYLAQRAEAVEEGQDSAGVPTVAAPVELESRRPEARRKMSRRRRTIARRLLDAQQSTASLTTFNDIDLTAVVNFRQNRQESFAERHGFRLGFTSFFVKAAVAALKAYPRLNAEIDGNEIVLKYFYDIGIAVGAEEGLVVPVIRDADRKSLAELEGTIRTLAQKAHDNKLSLEELRGGTFTISNGGVFGSLLSTPILNPPQVGILGLHRIEERPVARDGEVVIHPMMYVALSYDHRIVDGREAVQFLNRIKELIEDPGTLLLEG